MARTPWMARAVFIAVLSMVLVQPVLAGRMEGRTSRSADSGAPWIDTPAVRLRVTLDRLLGEHALLAVQAMRTSVGGLRDASAAVAALEANTRDLQQAVAAVYGEQAGERFAELWRSHLRHILDYTSAVVRDDENGQRTAVEALERYTRRFSTFLSSANPHLPRDVLVDLLQEHVTLLESIAPFVEGDFDSGFVAAHHLYEHMFTIGDNLALAIVAQFPKKFPGGGAARSPAASLRLGLDRLVGEHVFYAVEAMRAGVSRDGSFAAAQEAMESNSTELEQAVRQVYGARAARAFGDLWRRHTRHYLEYIRGVAGRDRQQQSAALRDLETFTKDFAAFLSAANPHLDRRRLEALIKEHARHLAAQVAAYARGEYAAAYRIAREAYAHGFAISGALGEAIAAQFPERFPALPETTTEERQHRRFDAVLLLLLSLAGLSLLAPGLRLAARSPSPGASVARRRGRERLQSTVSASRILHLEDAETRSFGDDHK